MNIAVVIIWKKAWKPTTLNKKQPVPNNTTIVTAGSAASFKLFAVSSYFVARSWKKV